MVPDAFSALEYPAFDLGAPITPPSQSSQTRNDSLTIPHTGRDTLERGAVDSQMANESVSTWSEGLSAADAPALGSVTGPDHTNDPPRADATLPYPLGWVPQNTEDGAVGVLGLLSAQLYRTQSPSPPRLASMPSSSRRSASIAPSSNDDDAIRCVCGVPEDDGFSIACDVCSRWCHAACFAISPGAVPDEWRCWLCAPTHPHDAAWARRLQLDRLARLAAEPPRPPPGTEEDARQGTTSPDVERGRKKERDGAGAAGQKTDHDHASGVDAGDYTSPVVAPAHDQATRLPPIKDFLEMMPANIRLPSSRKRKRSDAEVGVYMVGARKRDGRPGASDQQLAERQSLPGEESWSFPSKSEKYLLRCARCSKPETSLPCFTCAMSTKPEPTYEVRLLIYLAGQNMAPPAIIAPCLKTIAADKVAREFLLSRTGAEAECLVSLLQRVSDLFRRKVVALLLKLSVASGVLPPDLFIQGVSIGDQRDPWTSGGFADVFRGVYNHQSVAVKRLRVLNEDTATVNPMICREALLWRQLNHPHILPFLGVDAETFAPRNALCLISPWMERGTLKQYITSASYHAPSDRYRLLQEVAQGIDYLHEENVVHGDINWINIFIGDGAHAKIADFGLAVIHEATGGGTTTTHTGPKGTVAWMSPERIDGSSRLKPPMDVYSFGILCLTMWTRKRPFPALNDFAIVLRVTKGQRPEQPAPENCRGETLPGDMWALIEKCWAQDPLARPHMTEVWGSLTALSVTEAWDSDSGDEWSGDEWGGDEWSGDE